MSTGGSADSGILPRPCREIETRIPAAAMDAISAEEPKLRKGSGMPVRTMVRITPATLKKACNVNQATMPKASSVPKRSSARIPARIPR